MKQQDCTLLFLVKKDHVLLAMKKRGFGEGRWNGVGGKIDANETEEQAMVRECLEEIEVAPKDFEKTALMTFLYDGEHGKAKVIVHVYISTKWAGEPAETEEMAPQWFKITEIPYDQMWDDDRYWLPQMLEGQKLEGRFAFDQEDKVVSSKLREVKSL